MLHDETASARVTLRTGLSYSSAKTGVLLQKGKPRMFTDRDTIEFFLKNSRFEVTQFSKDGTKIFVPTRPLEKIAPASVRKASVDGDGWPSDLGDDEAQIEATKKLKEVEEAWLKEEAEAAEAPPKLVWKTNMDKASLAAILAKKLGVATVPEMTKKQLIAALEYADAKDESS